MSDSGDGEDLDEEIEWSTSEPEKTSKGLATVPRTSDDDDEDTEK